MKVKRSYALDLNAVLANSVNNFEKPISGRFRYMVSNNLKVTGEERKAVIEAFPDDPAYIEFENRRITMLREAGINSNEDIAKLTDEQRNELEQKVLQLRDECKEAIDAQTEIAKERDKFNEEEVELDLRTVPLSDVPNIIAQDDWFVWEILRPIVTE